jgi:hypothetical protein
MLFMVVEDLRGRDPKAIYRRFRDKGTAGYFVRRPVFVTG